MGTLFLVDAHSPVLLNSEINDTLPVEFGDTQVLNGSFGVNVPFRVPLDGTPSNLTELINQKFTGLLATYPGYTSIDYDDGLDGSGWDVVNSQGVCVGSRGTTSISSFGGLISNTIVLTGSAPSEAIVTWEAFEITGFATENPKDGILVRRYSEVDSSELTASVSFDGGTSWVASVLDGVQFVVPPWQQGINFLIRLNNYSGRRIWVGSWSVIY